VDYSGKKWERNKPDSLKSLFGMRAGRNSENKKPNSNGKKKKRKGSLLSTSTAFT
jgi:hypothetical protein